MGARRPLARVHASIGLARFSFEISDLGRPAMAFDRSRRHLLKGAAALGGCALAAPFVAGRRPARGWSADYCATPAGAPQALAVPGDDGYLGRLAPRGTPLTLTARPRQRGPAGSGTLEYVCEHQGQRYLNPSLVVERGERVRVRLVNALDEPTITHWHGLSVSARNDGNGSVLAPPGDGYDYDFDVRDRAAMYWYHPHPHGRSAAQTYRGLHGLVFVEDDDERALRAALDLSPAETEIPLVLRDRRQDRDYLPAPLDLARGLVGDDIEINGTLDPYLAVGTRLYRLRLLNAANARTFRIAFRTASGRTLPFTLVGSDGGLLAAPVRCEQAFLATAERIDLLLDLRDAAVGDIVRMDTLAFEPMVPKAIEMAPSDHAAMGGSGAAKETRAHAYDLHWPEGAARTLLELRVRKKVPYDRTVPARLSTLAALDAAGANERPFRLGFAKGRWRINDRVFETEAPPIEVRRNTVESWLVRNYHTSMPHAMHLHGFRFDVLARETSPDDIARLQQDAQGRLATDLGRKDTVLVWPGESVRLAIDFKLPFPGPQAYLFHCHNLEHEDAGMMLPVLVT